MIFAIVHYNTPELLTCCISSILKQYENTQIMIFENSNKYKFENIFGNNVKIIDNSNNQLINFDIEIENLIKNNNLDKKLTLDAEKQVSNFGTFKHSLSVQYLLDTINEDFILLDSDVLLKKRLDIDASSSIIISDYNENRIIPFIIKFNIKVVKQHKILFCDNKHILPVKPLPEYDTGGYFLSQIKDKNLNITKINYEDYIVHYGNGSWKENGNKKSSLKRYKIDKFQWLNVFKELWF